MEQADFYLEQNNGCLKHTATKQQRLRGRRGGLSRYIFRKSSQKKQTFSEECYSWVLEADEKYEALDNAHDTGYKYLLEIKKIFVQLMRSFVKQGWAQKIDEDSVEKINKTFITQNFKRKEADIVYKVKIDGQEVFFYILLELQSTVDFQMPFRLLQYMLEIWRTILQDTEKNEVKRKDFRLPMIVPCVLYNGKDNWTACRSFRETLEGHEQFGEFALDFKYVLFDVKRYDDEELLKLANIIGVAFFMDKEPSINITVERLKLLLQYVGEISAEDFNIFMIWFNNVFLNGLDKETVKKVSETIEKKGDVGSMVYAIQEAFIEERIKAKREGKIEAILELLNEVGNVTKNLEEFIKAQKDMEIISSWHKISAKVDSINEFMSRIGYIQ